MTISTILDPLAGERVVGLSPGTAVEAAGDWLRRPNIFPGRALTATAMTASQGWQAGHLAMRGRDWVAGVVDGLEAQVSATGAAGFAGARLRISQGRGLAVSGEDAVLTRPLDCLLADVPVVAPPGFFVDGSGVEAGTEGESPTLLPRSIGVSLGALSAASLATLPLVGVLVLQPVTVDESDFDPLDPCEHSACDEGTSDDPAARQDWRTTDALRLLWYVWPGEWRGMPPVGAAQLRNALAWTVFQAAEALGEDEALPWEDWGVPVAMVALTLTHDVAWMDRASVVRQGGRARDDRLHFSGTTMVADSRLPSLWQSRIEQLAEQIAAAGEPAPPPGTLADAFSRFLPPVGLIPRDGYDPVAHASPFFPPGFSIDAVPVPVEQLDVAVRASAALAPLNLAAPETVRILVPVPLQSWEPRLLLTEIVDPQFQATLGENLLRRARTLGLRQGLRNQSAMLTHALTGQVPVVANYNDDPDALEPESLSPWGPPPPGGGHRSSLQSVLHQHLFLGATTPFVPVAGESLFVWVCLDPDNPPACLMLQWHLADGWEHRAYWGADVIAMGSGNTTPGHFRVGDLPTPGLWQMLKVPAASVGLAGKSIDGMAFTLSDGRAAYGLTGARTDTTWRKWFCNFLPLGGRVQGNEAWDLLTANDLWSPFEARNGVEPSLPDLTVPTGSGLFGGPVGSDTPVRAVPQSGYNLLYPVATGWRGHTLQFANGSAMGSLTNVTDSLQSWIYLDELRPPRALLALVATNILRAGGGSAGSGLTLTYWGEDRLTELSKATSDLNGLLANAQRGGALPRPGPWLQLPLPVADITKTQGAVQQDVTLVLLMAYDGNLAFSEIAVVPAAAGSAPRRVWPATIAADDSTTPPFAPYLDAQLVRQHNLGVLTPTPSSRIGTVEVYTDLVSDVAIGKLSTHEQSQILLRGLSGFSDYLSTRVDRTDDIIDFGFTHMQVDIYRLRQLIMSTTDATRLAISPSLAAIAKSDSAVVVEGQIKDYITSLKSPTSRRAVATSTAALAAPATAVATANFASTMVARVDERAQLIRAPQAPAQIVYSTPILGLSEVRTTAIANRLQLPPSPEARDYALRNRVLAVTSLVNLLEQYLAEDSGETPAILANFQVPGLLNDPFLVHPTDASRPLADFRNGATTGLYNLLGTPPTGTADVDEAVVFSQTVAISDNTIAMLRQLEARQALYRDALASCNTALSQLNDVIASAAARMRQVDDGLAEARYDVSVARSLLAEETQRVAGVNARRAQVLADDVKFLAYIRPRETDNLLDTPTHPVDPGLVDPPVPACLRQHPDAPAEMQDMLRVVREAPATWFRPLTPIVASLTRVDQLVQLARSAQARAISGVAIPRPAASTNLTSAFGASLVRLVARQVDAVAPRLAAVRSLDIPTLAASSWHAIRAQVAPVVSFGDLAEGGHGRADAASAAASELDDIHSVATCLHAEFSGVLPVLRLRWAQTLSEFDAAPDLRDLSSLSRWVEIAADDRRRMQAYVDWLFGLIDRTQSGAVALINDVVRMCLLLASHAPVDRIISGRLAKPVTGVVVGTSVPLSVLDSTMLSVGMQALMYRGDTLVARATVDDVGPRAASARLIQTSTTQVDLGDDVRVHFGQTAMLSLADASASRTLFRP